MFTVMKLLGLVPSKKKLFCFRRPDFTLAIAQLKRSDSRVGPRD